MKKTLLALAALAATSAAMAQSSVTLYGVVDASVESVKGDKSVTRVTSDNLATSRLGVKGVEDIGGGVKAAFNLESAVKADTGAQGNSARFWDRAAWVGLGSSAAGELRLGRIDSAIGDIAGNVLSAQNYDDLKIVGTRAGDKYRRVDNTLTYVLPTLVPGLTTTLQYSTAAVGYKTTGVIDTTVAGNEAAGNSAGKAYGLGVKYAAGQLSAGLGYLSAKDENNVLTGSQKANATLVYAGYDLGVAKVTAYYDAESSPALFTATTALTSANNRRMSVLGAKVAVPLSTEFTTVVSAAQARNVSGLAAGTDNVQIFTVKGIYTLSKRTALYAMLTNVNNGKATTKAPFATTDVAVTADQTTRGIAAGIRHAF